MVYANSCLLLVFCLAASLDSGQLRAQASGAAPAAGTSVRVRDEGEGFGARLLSPEEAENVITIDGTAEVRVEPTQLRMVLAAVSEAETANECSQQAKSVVSKIRQGWMAMGVPANDIFEDFIAILPVYEFEETKWQMIDALKERLVRYRLQTNLHVKLANEEQAHAAMKIAFAEGVTDIIAFDYWSSELDQAKVEALKKALKVAREKSDLLLSTELFPTKPKLINLTEDVRAIFPKQMYLSFENSVAQSVNTPYNWRDNVPRIFAARPRTTFYNGLELSGDAMSPELPMRPAISIVGQVKLYFEAPSDRWNRVKSDAR
jgi:uncharacterized protein YggE